MKLISYVFPLLLIACVAHGMQEDADSLASNHQPQYGTIAPMPKTVCITKFARKALLYGILAANVGISFAIIYKSLSDPEKAIAAMTPDDTVSLKGADCMYILQNYIRDSTEQITGSVFEEYCTTHTRNTIAGLASIPLLLNGLLGCFGCCRYMENC